MNEQTRRICIMNEQIGRMYIYITKNISEEELKKKLVNYNIDNIDRCSYEHIYVYVFFRFVTNQMKVPELKVCLL